MGEIPYELGDAQKIFEEDEDEEELKYRIRELLEVLVASLAELVRILNRTRPKHESRYKRFMSKLNVDAQDSRSIDAMLKELQKAKTKVRDHADHLSRKAVKHVKDGLDEHRRQFADHAGAVEDWEQRDELYKRWFFANVARTDQVNEIATIVYRMWGDMNYKCQSASKFVPANYSQRSQYNFNPRSRI